MLPRLLGRTSLGLLGIAAALAVLPAVPQSVPLGLTITAVVAGLAAIVLNILFA